MSYHVEERAAICSFCNHKQFGSLKSIPGLEIGIKDCATTTSKFKQNVLFNMVEGAGLHVVSFNYLEFFVSKFDFPASVCFLNCKNFA